MVGGDKLLQSYNFLKGKSVTFCRALRHNMGSSRVSKTSQSILSSSWKVWKKMKTPASARSDVFACFLYEPTIQCLISEIM